MLTRRDPITATTIVFTVSTPWVISAACAWIFPAWTHTAGCERHLSRPGRLALQGSAVFLLFVLMATGAAAQGRPGGPPGGSPPSGGGGGLGRGVGMSMDMNEKGSIVVRVLGPHGTALQQQAFVRLYSVTSGVLLSGGMTNLDGSLSFDNLPSTGYYTVEVSAAGYQTRRKTFDFPDTLTFTEVDVTMWPVGAVSTASYAPASNLPRKARKHIEKGVVAFRAGKLKRAQKQLIGAYNAAPQSPLTNYLLGVLYLRMKDMGQSERYFTNAVQFGPTDVPALVGLGHVRYQKEDLKGSEEALQKAVALDPKQWDALWLLADIHLRQHAFQKAGEEARSAVEFGKGAGNGAEFIEAEALAELGRTREALTRLRAFLKDAPSDPNAPVARQLAARLEMEMDAAPVNSTPAVATQRVPTLLSQAFPAVAVSAPKLPPPDWEPSEVDQERPPVADGVTCPTSEVMQKAGERVAQFVSNVNRIDATEKVTLSELSTRGRPVFTEKRTFDYMISITHSAWGLLDVSEDRQGEGSLFLGHMSMFGLAELPLIFHPSLRRDFQLTCEGLGNRRRRATWLVYFRQRSDRPKQVRSYRLLDGSSYGAALKGRAWIAADSYQIVRIEADLMKAIPEVGLGSEEDVVDYAPVRFPSKKLLLWLPSTADIYYFYKHRPYHCHHAFTDYRLFSVSSTQKIGRPDTSGQENKERR